jgi:hypothetical protein
MHCRHSTLYFLSGLVWLAAGCNLLPLGLRLLLGTLDPAATAPTPLLQPFIQWMASPQQAVQLLIILGLFIGFLKGRTVLAKAVHREITRISQLPSPASITHLYGKKALVVLAIMVLLGMSMKWLALPSDIRGFIDVAVGAALINGAVIYFRQAFVARRTVQR